MKTFYVLAVISTLAVSIKAGCDCDATDVLCLQSCVQRGNDCISQCQNPGCYSNCVDDHWPGADLNYPNSESMSFTNLEEVSTRSETPKMTSYATMTSTEQWQSTEASGASNRGSMASSSTWNPSSTWSAVPTWTNSASSSISNSLRSSATMSGPASSSTNASQKLATSNVVSILGLGVAFYYLYFN